MDDFVIWLAIIGISLPLAFKFEELKKNKDRNMAILTMVLSIFLAASGTGWYIGAITKSPSTDILYIPFAAGVLVIFICIMFRLLIPKPATNSTNKINTPVSITTSPLPNNNFTIDIKITSETSNCK